jgi:hypothetical protein
MCICLQIFDTSLKFDFVSKQCRQSRHNVTLRRVLTIVAVEKLLVEFIQGLCLYYCRSYQHANRIFSEPYCMVTLDLCLHHISPHYLMNGWI